VGAIAKGMPGACLLPRIISAGAEHAAAVASSSRKTRHPLSRLMELSRPPVLCRNYLTRDQSPIDPPWCGRQSIRRGGGEGGGQLPAATGALRLLHADAHSGTGGGRRLEAYLLRLRVMGSDSPTLRSRIGRMWRAQRGRDAIRPWWCGTAGRRGLISRRHRCGPVRRLVRGDAERRPSPSLRRHKCSRKLSATFTDLVYGQHFRLPLRLIFVDAGPIPPFEESRPLAWTQL